MRSIVHVLGDAAALATSDPDLTVGTLSLVGALVGYLFGRTRQHPVLGVFAGMGAGAAAGQAVVGRYALAATYAASTAAGTGVSLYWKPHPVMGYALGAFGGSLVVGTATGETLKK